MNDALDLCDLAVTGVAMFEPAAFDDDLLRTTALRLQSFIDRLKVVQSKVLAEADGRRTWEGTGARDMADWLAGKTKSSYGDAKRKVRLGNSLGSSKKLSDAVDKGDVSPDSAEQLHDAVTNPPDGTDDNDVDELISSVKNADPKEAKRAADRWKQIHSKQSPEEAEDRRYQARSLKTSAADDGMVTSTLKLPALQSRIVMNAANHASPRYEGDQRTTEQRMADGMVAICDAYAKGQVRGGREKPTLLITVSAESMAGTSNEPGVTAQGDLIPAHVVRQLAEQAELRRVVLAGSEILDLGRAERYATDAQYKALVARDGECRWPGCHAPASWCDADHIIPWEQGGPTDIGWLWLLCRHHHTERHRPGVTVLGNASNTQIRLRDGTIIDCPSPRRTRQAAA